MRILILSCNTGQGHNSAASAVSKYFTAMGDTCETHDALSFWSPANSRLICSWHCFIYKNMPRLFGLGYDFEDRHPPKSDENSIMYELVIKGCEQLHRHLCENSYDRIICTHVFPAMMMTELSLRKDIHTPTYFISTDYTCHPGVSETRISGYIIPHNYLLDEFTRCGISENKICAAGMPISDSFYTNLPQETARQMLRLPQDKKIVLVMCGSIGSGPICEMTALLSQDLPPECHIVAICGKNRKAYNTLASSGRDNVTVVGYTTRVSLYMDAADLLLTKPGGLTISEAAVKHLPMVLIDAIPGCEARNLKFFCEYNFAATAQNSNALSQTVRSIFLSNTELYNMKKQLCDNFSHYACEKIYNFILQGESQ